MNTDLISRAAALRVINAYDCHELTVEDVIKVTDGCANEIIKLPAVDAEPVRHGRWITKYDILGNELDVCSECGEEAVGYDTYMGDYRTVATDYCPHCGAKMDLEETNDQK